MIIGIGVENGILKDNIMAACRALIEFGRPNETNPKFWCGGYDFCNRSKGMYKCVYLGFTCSDGKRMVIKITENNCQSEIYKVIKKELNCKGGLISKRCLDQ